jgi:hypothetical protein
MVGKEKAVLIRAHRINLFKLQTGVQSLQSIGGKIEVLAGRKRRIERSGLDIADPSDD